MKENKEKEILNDVFNDILNQLNQLNQFPLPEGNDVEETREVKGSNETSSTKDHENKVGSFLVPNNNIEGNIILLSVVESDDMLFTKFSCVGLSKKDISISHLDGVVSVSLANEGKSGQALWFKAFDGNIDVSSVKVKLERGVLNISVKKVPDKEPVMIHIS